jgi:hypothetical protein
MTANQRSESVWRYTVMSLLNHVIILALRTFLLVD